MVQFCQPLVLTKSILWTNCNAFNWTRNLYHYIQTIPKTISSLTGGKKNKRKNKSFGRSLKDL